MDAYDTRKYFMNIQGRKKKKNKSKYNVDINIVLLLITIKRGIVLP